MKWKRLKQNENRIRLNRYRMTIEWKWNENKMKIKWKRLKQDENKIKLNNKLELSWSKLSQSWSWV